MTQVCEGAVQTVLHFWNVVAMNGKTITLLKTHIYELFKIYAFYRNI